MTTREWPELAGEISGFGKSGGRGPAYEACCRRMILAAADWVEENPRTFIEWKEKLPKVAGASIFVAANWETVIRPSNPPTRALCDAIHKACCNGGGDNEGPSFAMMQKALQAAQYIKRHGWDAYVALLATRRDGAGAA